MARLSWVEKIRAIAWKEANKTTFEVQCTPIGDFGEGMRYEHMIILDIQGMESGHSEQLLIRMVGDRRYSDEDIAKWLQEEVTRLDIPRWHPEYWFRRYFAVFTALILGFFLGTQI